MNNDFTMETTKQHRKTPIIIIILLTACISFFTGMLFGTNDNMLLNTNGITTKIKNTILPNNNKNTIGSNFKNKIAEKIKQANGIEEDDYIEEEENEIDLQIQPVEQQATSKQNNEQELLNATLRDKLIQQEQLQRQSAGTDNNIIIGDIKPMQQDINNNTIVVNSEKTKTDASIKDDNIKLTTTSTETENKPDNATITTQTDNKNTNNKDTVYVVMVNNNNVNSGSKTNNQNIAEEKITSPSNKSQQQKPSNISTKKQDSIKTNKALDKKPVKQKRKQDTLTNKSTAQETTKTKTQKKKKTNVVKQNISQKTINNSNKKETKNNEVDTEELIIELDNYEDIQKLQNVDVETLIVVDNETGEEYEIVPDSTNTNKDNKTGK